MRDQALFDKIDLHLIRVLHTVLTERSVSQAASELGMYQPAVSASLKRLRELAGDPFWCARAPEWCPRMRAAHDRAQRKHPPCRRDAVLRAPRLRAADAATTFRVAAADYLDPLFLPHLVARIKSLVPLCHIEIHPLSAASDYHAHLATAMSTWWWATG
jgi:DNA-binding transcriptional LysR family regulator